MLQARRLCGESRKWYWVRIGSPLPGDMPLVSHISEARAASARGISLPELLNETVGHAGDVVGDRARKALRGDLFLVIGGHLGGVFHERRKELPDNPRGMLVVLLHTCLLYTSW